jgi:hypothetical protein
VVKGNKVQEARNLYGADMVDVKHIVTTLKVKRNASGEITKWKARACIGDRKKDRKVPDTYSSAVSSTSRKLQANLFAVLPGAKSSQNDVENAYYRGKVPLASEGGRALFCHIPDEWEELGYELYDPVDGTRNMLEIEGNVPGRQEAGKIWGGEYTHDFY